MIHLRNFGLSIANVSRRSLLLGLGAGSLVLALRLPLRAQEAKKYGGEAMPGGLVKDPQVFVAIGEDGTVTILAHRSEMGQGVRTSLPLVIADELEADWARVTIQQAVADEGRYGSQDTDGSRSMRQHFAVLRRMGATVRRMLEEAAAAEWQVPVEEVRAENHTVLHAASGRRLDYGALAEAAAALPLPAEAAIRLKTPAEFRYIGREGLDLIDNVAITTGQARYGIDTELEGMVHAVVARPPVYGGKVAAYDAAAALAVPGVLKVVELPAPSLPSAFLPLGGIAVIAENTWAAIRGREALQITWDDGPNGGYDTAGYRALLTEAVRAPGKVVRESGDLETALAGAAQRVEAEYYVPHHAHATMEPPAAVVRIRDGLCEAWACVQAPEATREGLSQLLDIPFDKVTVNVTLLGGGFGRKSKPDFVFEAGLLSQALGGRPVKMTWTREDDMAHDFLNTTMVSRLEAGLDEEGLPVALLYRTAAPSITSIFQPGVVHEAPFELGMGAVDMPFDVPNLRVENPEAAAHTRIGWFRAVFNIPHAFALQSFVAELAAAAGRDPKDYLLAMIGPDRRIDPATLSETWNYGEDPALYPIDTGRLRRVIEVAAEGAEWGRALPQGSGLGIAAHRSFASYIAAVVEVAVDPQGAVSVPRVDIAVDCGPVVNPDRVRSQMEGAVVQGLGIALLSDITFREGRVEQTNFDSYEVPRIDMVPRDIRVHLLPAEDYTEPLGGVGEPGVPPVVPALLNAVFAASGKRIRSLPLGNQLAT